MIEFEELDLLAFLDEHGIDFETSGKNIGPGWAAINPCPKCGDSRNHFAINIGNKSLSCWVCGLTGTLIKFLMMYFNIDQDQAENMIKGELEEKELFKDMDLESLVKKTFTAKPPEIEEDKPMHKLDCLPGKPINKVMVEERAKLRAFMKDRGITVGQCKRFKFRYDYERSMRFIMPIYCPKETLIGYQGRDITGRALLSYITQPKEAPIGKTLFNIKEWKSTRRTQKAETVIITEGIIDALSVMENLKKHHKQERIGKFSVVMACFRNKPTIDQMKLISDAYMIISMLDSDSWFNCKEFEENCLHTEVYGIALPRGKDPGSITDEEFLSLDLPQYLS